MREASYARAGGASVGESRRFHAVQGLQLDVDGMAQAATPSSRLQHRVTLMHRLNLLTPLITTTMSLGTSCVVATHNAAKLRLCHG
jgi:hypothetical protein